MKNNRLVFKGSCVRIYDDFESCSLFIIGDFGEIEDDNFYTPFDLYQKYIDMALSYYGEDDQNEDFRKDKINFEKYLKKSGISYNEIEQMREDYEDNKKMLKSQRALELYNDMSNVVFYHNKNLTRKQFDLLQEIKDYLRDASCSAYFKQKKKQKTMNNEQLEKGDKLDDQIKQ